MLAMDAVRLLLEWLKDKEQLSQLEYDILETSREFSKLPFDRPAALLRMGQNYSRYPEIFIEAGLASGGNAQPNYTLSDDEIRNNLCWQLLELAKKEREAIGYGKQT